MINNRQAGRRRGRGGGGGGSGGQRQGRPDNGNRIDSRARGNAAQLLEKYKNLAADAQRQGDRVNTENYLQFADHYFRVLSEQRGRFEEPRRQDSARDEFDGDEEFGDEGEPIRQGEQMEPRRERAERGDRQERGERQDRSDRQDRSERFERRPRSHPVAAETPVEVGGQHRADPIDATESLADRAEAVLEADAPLAPRRRGRPRRVQPDQPAVEADAPAGMDADRLPPALMMPANDAADGEEAPRPRRRRTPRATAAEAPDAAE